MDEDGRIAIEQRRKEASEAMWTILNRILAQNPEDLNKQDREFLNARRSYLTNEQRRVFASVLIDERVAKNKGKDEVKEELA
jgi:hypothetical protein